MSYPMFLPIRRTMNTDCPLYHQDRASTWQSFLTLEFETKMSYLDRNVSPAALQRAGIQAGRKDTSPSGRWQITGFV